MIILVNPMYSIYQNLNADSFYIFTKLLITQLTKKYKDFYFLYIFPDEKSGFVYQDDGFFDNPNVIVIKKRMVKRKLDNVLDFPFVFWRNFFDNFTPDIIWSHSVETSHFFYNFVQSFEEGIRFKIINQHHYVLHHTLPYPEVYMLPAQFQQTACFLVDMNIFNSHYCYKMMVENMKKYLNDETIAKMKYKIIHFALLDPDYYPKPQPADLKKIKIIYNHRLSDYKNYQITFKLLNELWKKYQNFEVFVTNPNAENFSKISHYPFVRGISCANHKDYLEILKTCHLNITNSQHETFCISALESLAMGQILVAPNGITFPELTYPNYPFLFNSLAEQREILEKIFSNPKIIEQYREEIYKKTWEKFYYEIMVQEYYNLFTQLEKEYRLGNFKKSVFKVLNYIKTLKGFKSLKELSTIFKRFNLGQQAFPLIKIKKLLNSLGYKDYFHNSVQGIFFE